MVEMLVTKHSVSDEQRQLTALMDRTHGPTISDRPANDTPSIALGSYLQGEYLGRVKPRNGEPGGTKCSTEEESEGRGCSTKL